MTTAIQDATLFVRWGKKKDFRSVGYAIERYHIYLFTSKGNRAMTFNQWLKKQD